MASALIRFSQKLILKLKKKKRTSHEYKDPWRNSYFMSFLRNRGEVRQ